MDGEELRLWMQGINMVGTFGLGVWMYLESRSDKTNEKVATLSAAVGKLDKDMSARIDGVAKTASAETEEIGRSVAALQKAAEGAPSHADLAKVYESINGLAATVHTLVGENRGQSDTLRLILNQITQKGLK